MTIFRPCIDLHAGKVKQIVGSSLTTDSSTQLKTNFVSSLSAADYARLYKEHNLRGGHLIMLGPGNEEAALEALSVWPNGLQVGGGISKANGQKWLGSGAEKIIVTSWLFDGSTLDMDRLRQLSESIDGRRFLVVDLSCKSTNNGWNVVTEKWQRSTDITLCTELFESLSEYCAEFLVHAADVEGLCNGIDERLVQSLSTWSRLPVTYAGGARSAADLQKVKLLSDGRVDLTIGSSLDIFGGSGATLEECIKWNRREI